MKRIICMVMAVFAAGMTMGQRGITGGLSGGRDGVDVSRLFVDGSGAGRHHAPL